MRSQYAADPGVNQGVSKVLASNAVQGHWCQRHPGSTQRLCTADPGVFPGGRDLGGKTSEDRHGRRAGFNLRPLSTVHWLSRHPGPNVIQGPWRHCDPGVLSLQENKCVRTPGDTDEPGHTAVPVRMESQDLGIYPGTLLVCKISFAALGPQKNVRAYTPWITPVCRTNAIGPTCGWVLDPQ